MTLLRRERLQVKLGDYRVGDSSAFHDPGYVAEAQDYRRHLAARMFPLEASDIRKRITGTDLHVSLKVDGEFTLLVYVDGELATVNPGGTVRVGLACLKEAEELLKKKGIRKALIAGELHYHRPDGKRPRVHDVCRVARQPASTAEIDGLRFAAFDIVELDGVRKQTEPFAETRKQLEELFGKGKLCQVVPGEWVKDAAAVETQFREWVDAGHEGAVVRSDASIFCKIKPRHTIDAVVIGFTEGVDDRKGMIHDLLVALMRPDGCFHVLGHVGGGFTENDRREFLSDLKDMVVPSEYVEVNDQVAYHMVRPEWVIEISVLEVISQTTRGGSIGKMVLDWSEKRWKIIRKLPLVAMISPQFVRRRDDKTVNATDLRVQQVADLVEINLIDRDARQLNLSKSRILRREVFSKIMKGKMMVRKFVLWATEKDKESDDYPAFVLHFTDYSPNRKTPLERDIRVSNSSEQIEELWRELLSENLASGWLPAGKPSLPTDAVEVAPPAKKRTSKKSEPEPTEEPAIETAPAPRKRTTKKKAE